MGSQPLNGNLPGDGVLIKPPGILGLPGVSELGVRKSIRPYKTLPQIIMTKDSLSSRTYFAMCEINPDLASIKKTCLCIYS